MPVNFENRFSKYRKTEPVKLYIFEIKSYGTWLKETVLHSTLLDGLCFNYCKQNSNVYLLKTDLLRIIYRIVNKLKWGPVYIIAKDEDGYLSKESWEVFRRQPIWQPCQKECPQG